MTLLGNVDNDIVVGSIFLVAVWCSSMMLRILYLLSEDTDWIKVFPPKIRQYLPSTSPFTTSFLLPHNLTLIVYGYNIVKALSLAYLLLACFLTLRIDSSMIDTSAYSNTAALSISYWAAARVLASIAMCLSVHVMSSHLFLRVFVCCLVGPLVIADLCSEMGIATLLTDQAAIQATLSNTLPGSLSSLLTDPGMSTAAWFALRDTVSACCGLMLLFFCCWLSALWGTRDNRQLIPRREHQIWAAQVNSQRKKKEKQAKSQTEKQQPLLKTLFA